MHRKGIVFIFIYKLTNFECSANLKVPSPELVNISKLCGPVRDKVRGLEPRFEALTQFVKSPNTPGSISTESPVLILLSQHTNISQLSRLVEYSFHI